MWVAEVKALIPCFERSRLNRFVDDLCTLLENACGTKHDRPISPLNPISTVTHYEAIHEVGI